jgi:hypothetical protein
MPTATNAKLTLTKVGDTDIRVHVTYNFNLSRLESHLVGAGFGVGFTELVQIIGIDPPGSTTGTTMQVVGSRIVDDAVNQDEPQTLQRSYTRTFPRADLDEDRSVLAADNDEIRCRIRLICHGLPEALTNTFTNQVVLFEDAGSTVQG